MMRIIYAGSIMSIENILSTKLSEAQRYAVELFNKPEMSLTDPNIVPVNGGVYLFHEHIPGSPSEKLYVGIAKKLKRRIHTDHLSAEASPSMSSLRRSLNKVRGMAFGPDMRKWLQNNCSISFVEVEDPDMRALVEALVIAVLRPSGKILNKP